MSNVISEEDRAELIERLPKDWQDLTFDEYGYADTSAPSLRRRIFFRACLSLLHTDDTAEDYLANNQLTELYGWTTDDLGGYNEPSIVIADPDAPGEAFVWEVQCVTLYNQSKGRRDEIRRVFCLDDGSGTFSTYGSYEEVMNEISSRLALSVPAKPSLRRRTDGQDVRIKLKDDGKAAVINPAMSGAIKEVSSTEPGLYIQSAKCPEFIRFGTTALNTLTLRDFGIAVQSSQGSDIELEVEVETKKFFTDADKQQYVEHEEITLTFSDETDLDDTMVSNLERMISHGGLVYGGELYALVGWSYGWLTITLRPEKLCDERCGENRSNRRRHRRRCDLATFSPQATYDGHYNYNGIYYPP